MNWFIYIAGWIWGMGIVNVLMHWEHRKDQEDFFTCVKVITWTMTWIWICWRFIS